MYPLGNEGTPLYGSPPPFELNKKTTNNEYRINHATPRISWSSLYLKLSAFIRLNLRFQNPSPPGSAAWSPPT